MYAVVCHTSNKKVRNKNKYFLSFENFSCESISYTKSRDCYLHDGAVETDNENTNCSVFTLNVITFEQELKPSKLFSRIRTKTYSFSYNCTRRF